MHMSDQGPGYVVFHRTWWRKNADWPRGLEPYLGNKTESCSVQTEEQARKECYNWDFDYNLRRTHNKKDKELGRKAEYIRADLYKRRQGPQR